MPPPSRTLRSRPSLRAAATSRGAAARAGFSRSTRTTTPCTVRTNVDARSAPSGTASAKAATGCTNGIADGVGLVGGGLSQPHWQDFCEAAWPFEPFVAHPLLLLCRRASARPSTRTRCLAWAAGAHAAEPILLATGSADCRRLHLRRGLTRTTRASRRTTRPTPRSTWCRFSKGHADRVYDTSFHPHEPILATCSADHLIKIWSVSTRSRSLSAS